MFTTLQLHAAACVFTLRYNADKPKHSESYLWLAEEHYSRSGHVTTRTYTLPKAIIGRLTASKKYGMHPCNDIMACIAKEQLKQQAQEPKVKLPQLCGKEDCGPDRGYHDHEASCDDMPSAEEWNEVYDEIRDQRRANPTGGASVAATIARPSNFMKGAIYTGGQRKLDNNLPF